MQGPTVYDAHCLACGLFKGCKSWKIPMDVYNAPNGKVDVLFVGSSPGHEEDEQGQHFMGAPGRYLKDFIKHFGSSFKYALTNVVKCSPGERDPSKEEIAECAEFLEADIERCDPQVLVALGGTALKALHPNGPGSINKARIAPVRIGKRWLVATYHPSQHVTKRQNLTDEYKRVGKIVDDLLRGVRHDAPQIQIIIPKTEADLVPLYRQVAASPLLVFDTETNWCGKDPARKTLWLPGTKLLSLQLATHVGEPVWVIPAYLITSELVRRLFTGKICLAHNAKFDLTVLMWLVGVPDLPRIIKGIEDTMLMSASRDLSRMGNGLKELSTEHLQATDWESGLWAIVEAKNKELRRLKQPALASLEDVPFGDLATYGGYDVFNTRRLLDVAVQEEWHRNSAYQAILKDATRKLAEIEYNGLPVNRKTQDILITIFQKQYDGLKAALMNNASVRRVCNRLPEEQHNPNSPKFLEELLEERGITVLDRTPTGRPKLDATTLDAVAEEDVVFKAIGELRKSSGLLSKFLIPLRELIAADGCIHTSYKMIKLDTAGDVGGTTTGRLASADPNLQNLATRTEIGKLMRRMFEVPEDELIVELDYAAIELRLIAWFSKCKRMLEIFNSKDADLHTETAKYLYKAQTPTSLQRANAKNMNFLMVYQGGAKLLAFKIGCSILEAQNLIDSWKRMYPEIFAWVELQGRIARSGKPMVTPFGRVRRFRYTGDDNIDAGMDRQAGNYPVQSTASDLTLFALNRSEWAPDVARFINIVHDSLWARVKKIHVPMFIERQSAIMEDHSCLTFGHDLPPTPVEPKVGRNLGQMEKYPLAA